MKYCCVTLAVAMAVVALTATPAHAVLEFKKQFAAKYVEGSDNAEFAAAVKKAKCNVCHFGKKKKNRNAYGMALSELLDKANFKRSRTKAEPDEVRKEIFAAFEKVESMKDPSGVTFGELFKAGKLPTPPAE